MDDAVRSRPALRRSSVPLAAALAVALHVLPQPAGALVLDTAEPASTRERPFDDPVWHAVGQKLGGPSVIYLGYGWVLTAHHVGAGIVVFDDLTYDPIPGTLHRLENVDGSSSDVLLFRIKDPPDLPPIRLASTAPRVGAEVTFIARGKIRGEPLTIDGPRGEPLDGFRWASNNARHWGTNNVALVSEYVPQGDSRTFTFATRFERIDHALATEHEAQGALGDSGGGVFTPANPYDSRDGWQLSGVISSVSHFDGQPDRTSFYGDATFMADVSYYRNQILRIARPQCSNGIDDDRDQRTDYPSDPSCISAASDDEARDADETSAASPGAIGALALACLAAALGIARLWRPKPPTPA